tara:strand:- start:12726 stop:12956 length:231 start_codon:yes stop_codon:yes gene_type:complete
MIDQETLLIILGSSAGSMMIIIAIIYIYNNNTNRLQDDDYLNADNIRQNQSSSDSSTGAMFRDSSNITYIADFNDV